MTSFSQDGNDGLGLQSHITGGLSSAVGNTATAGPSAVLAWVIIVAALLLLVFMGLGLRKVRV